MAAGIDLPTVAAATGVPHATLRYWVQVHGWQSVGMGPRGAKLYDALMVRDHIKTHHAFVARLVAEAERLERREAA